MNEGEVFPMAQLPSWTNEVSERLIDIQIAAERGDGRLISLIHETQTYVEAVERDINAVCTTLRTGTPPKRLRLVVSNTDDTPERAA